jgi:hypothetical protein
MVAGIQPFSARTIPDSRFRGNDKLAEEKFLVPEIV